MDSIVHFSVLCILLTFPMLSGCLKCRDVETVRRSADPGELLSKQVWYLESWKLGS